MGEIADVAMNCLVTQSFVFSTHEYGGKGICRRVGFKQRSQARWKPFNFPS